MNIVTIEVKECDRRRGVPSDGENCPLARAAKRAMPQHKDEIVVGVWTLWVGVRQFHMPANVEAFGRGIDDGTLKKRHFAPFSWEIDLEAPDVAA